MKLNNKYAIGTHVMFYEIEMYTDFINGLINLINPIENKENILIHLCFNTSQYFEKIDITKITKEELYVKFTCGIQKLRQIGIRDENILIDEKDDRHEIYNIADYRRDFNHNYCKKVDFLMWGETDSFFPKQAFSVLESIKEYGNINNVHRYILSFADRKMWDASWQITEHVNYENIKFIDTPDQVDNENYAKSPLSIEKMNSINETVTDLDLRITKEPKIDGSCLVISSDLIKSGVNIPHSLLCSGEDSSLGVIAKQLLGDQFIQIVVKNILKVHARRHPNKRMYVLNEQNPRGFCGKEKGDWWKVLQDCSKSNLSTLLNSQSKFYTFNDVFEKLKSL